MSRDPVSMVAADAPPRAKPTSPPFPPLMVAKVAGREKRPLGDLLGLKNFGVEVGDRSAGDSVSYPDDDVVAVFGADGKWKYTKKDGRPY